MEDQKIKHEWFGKYIYLFFSRLGLSFIRFKEIPLSIVADLLRVRFSSSMRTLLASERTKWIFVIGLVAIGAGFTAKNVISYPTECLPEKGLELTQLIRPLVWNAKITITLGLGIAAIGLLYPYLKQIGLGQLPGDIIVKGEHSTFYFPVVICIAISLLVSILLNLFRSS